MENKECHEHTSNYIKEIMQKGSSSTSMNPSTQTSHQNLPDIKGLDHDIFFTKQISHLHDELNTYYDSASFMYKKVKMQVKREKEQLKAQ